MKLKRMATLVSVTVLLMVNLATLVFPGQVMADNEDPDAEGKIWGDWNISLSKTMKDQTIEVSGNLTVLNGGTLVLDNVTLIMNSTTVEEWFITVKMGGDIQIINGSVVTNNATFDMPYYFKIEFGGGATITRSELRNMGNASTGQDFGLANLDRMGLYIGGNAVTIQDSTIRDSFVGTICTSLLPVSPVIVNTTYLNNTVGMAYVLSCNPEHRLNTYTDNDIGLTIVWRATAGVEGDTFIRNRAGIVTSLSTVSIKDVVIDNSTDAAIYGTGTSAITIETSKLTNNRNATNLDNSSLLMIDTLVTGSSGWDFFVDNTSTARIVNTTIDDRDGIKVNDTDSTLELAWYLDVKAEYLGGGPVNGAIVNLTTAQENKILNTATDSTGWIATEEIVELLDEGTGPLYFTPHNLTGEKGAYWNLTQVTMDRSQSVVLTLIERDLVLPDIIIEAPVSGAHVNNTTVHVSGVAYDDVGLSLVEVRLDQGNWTTTTGLDVWSIDIDLLTDGKYDICARVTDSSDNQVVECVNVTLDMVPPSLTVTVPEGDQYFNYSQLFVKGTTDADLLTINSDDVSVFSNSFSHAITLTSDGANDIIVVASDLAGNTNTTSLTVYRDLIPPSISVLSPQPDSTVNDTSVTVAGNVSDSLGVDEMQASLDKSTWRPVDINFTTAENKIGAFTVTLSLSEGDNRVHLRAFDRAGNVAGFEFDLTVELPDVLSPEVDIVTPSDGDRIDGLNVTVTGTANDDRALVGVEVSVGNVSFGPTTTDGWSTWSVRVILAEGTNVIMARATDEGGNVAEDTVTVTAIKPFVDTVKPELTITAPKNNKVSNKKTIRVEGTVTDNIQIKSVFVSVSTSGSGNEPEWILAELDTVTGTWSTEVTLDKGWNEVRVKAIDVSMNNETASILVKYQKAGQGTDYTMFILLIVIMIVLVVVYIATLPGREKARKASKGRMPYEDDEDSGDEEE